MLPAPFAHSHSKHTGRLSPLRKHREVAMLKLQMIAESLLGPHGLTSLRQPYRMM